MLLSKKSSNIDVEKRTSGAKKHHPEQQYLDPTFTFGGTYGPQEDLAEIDGLGRLCDAEETISNTSTTVDFSYDFVYDMRSQLTQASIEKNSSPYRNAVYNYRKDGNLDSRTINSSTTSFTYAGDLMDTASGGESFDLDFDDNGNMTTGVSQTITYNWDNKLRTATKGTKSISLRYDPGGNRIRKQSIDGADQTTRKYIVDIVGDLPTTLIEIDPNIDFIVKTYIYANGQVLCQNDGDYSAPRYFYIHGRTGSIRQIIDTYASVVRYYTYEPFGEVLEEDGTLTNYMMFTGQYFDTEIDQYYLRARQYDPHIARFTARDPVFGKFKEPLTLHRYLYCGNNPINYTDINGEWAVIVGGSFSGNITLGGASSLTAGLGIIGYYLGLFSQLSQTLECFGAGGTAGAGIFFGKNTEETGWLNTKGWFWGDIRWAAGGGSIATSSGASLTADFALSPNAMKAEHLEGWFTEYGGSVTFPAPVGSPFWFATASFTYAESDTGIDLYTLSGGTGISTWGIGGEGHIYRGYAWVNEW